MHSNTGMSQRGMEAVKTRQHRLGMNIDNEERLNRIIGQKRQEELRISKKISNK